MQVPGRNTYRLKSLAIQLLPVVQLQVVALILHHLRDVLTPEDPESSDGELSLRILEDAHHTKGVLAHIVYSLQEAANLPHSTYLLLTLLDEKTCLEDGTTGLRRRKAEGSEGLSRVWMLPDINRTNCWADSHTGVEPCPAEDLYIVMCGMYNHNPTTL